MEPVFIYLLKLITCSAVLFGYYRLALHNERFHQWNRFYLVAAMALSVIVPFINIPLLVESETDSLPAVVNNLPWNAIAAIDNNNINWQQLALYVSAAVTGLMLVKLLAGIVRIVALYKSHKVTGIQHQVLLIVTAVRNAPFSFFNWLFWRQDIDPASENGQRILEHELTHIRERHSLDKLFTSLLLCVFWMNPFFWLMRSELNIIHEFLADRKAVSKHDGAAFAKMILQSIPGPALPGSLVNPFFSSNIKRRLFMITSSNLPTYSYLRRISGLSLMVCSFFALAISIQQANAQDTKTKQKPHTLQKNEADTTRSGAKKSASVKRIQLKKAGTYTVQSDTLKGKVSGVKISAKGPLNDGKDAPIYIVEGKEVNASIVNALDGNKIASIDVLKAESATRVYGAKAVNGVIIVKLKKEVEQENLKEVVVEGYPLKKTAGNPLVIVDGKEITNEQMKEIKPETIESINVLKDEKAKQKYGEKAKDGVIEITLKKIV